MLSLLPAEIVYVIASYLPTASALVNLSQTCRRLYAFFSTEDWRIFRAFIQHRFPGIDTPPFWKDATQALTSRSRALDRNAAIGRFVLPSAGLARIGTHQSIRQDNPTHGYCPTVDCYEVWNGDRWENRQETVAWGAAHELAVGIKQFGPDKDEKWFVFNDLENTSSHDDICGLHLLKPGHYAKEANKEHLIFGRMRGDLVHIAIVPGDGSLEVKQRFLTNTAGIQHIDLSDGPESVLAAHYLDGTIGFFPTTSREEVVKPFAAISIEEENVARNKCSRFLSSDRFAVATGRLDDALVISTITSQSVTAGRRIGVDDLDLDDQAALAPKTSVSAIAPLNVPFFGGTEGDTFLSSWGDNVIRLHDLRSDRTYEAAYRDITDSNPVYCIHPFTQDKFVVGAGGDAVLKIFDLRMPRTYDSLEARGSVLSAPNQQPSNKSHIKAAKSPHLDLTMFLSYPPPHAQGFSNPGRARGRATRNYRGPIYNMSSPSLLSPTIYAGIEDAVVRLDFVSTDDLTGPRQSWYQELIDLDLSIENNPATLDHVLNLSGYERPDPRNTTHLPPLRTQQPFRAVGDDDVANESATGWDRRWTRVETGSWRRRD
ncbi:uncharacterized protein LDX57_005715 [Aspergillus melleus]|uniref:uncharacterized protein n=1 Tax=Aspergillus melleus TaxID=138277 RepID=UPI001E8CD72D|nr:uncharacterized protein LDX57_005715 [Aspergillus melleus]KAH8428010.1 hypothetical protein LDX57_005715 [Aspergillus melleus]